MSARTTWRPRMRGACSGRDAIIGLSIKSVAQAKAAPLDLLDYVAIGGVFVTTSKDNPDPPVGTDGLAHHCGRDPRARAEASRSARSPASTARNAADVIAAGADGVAVISALSMAPDPAAAARELRAVVDHALAQAGRAHDHADRRHHRGLGFERRRRHPGRPQDVLGARRLRRLGDHRADGAEHARRHARSTTCRRISSPRRSTRCSPISRSAR